MNTLTHHTLTHACLYTLILIHHTHTFLCFYSSHLFIILNHHIYSSYSLIHQHHTSSYSYLLITLIRHTHSSYLIILSLMHAYTHSYLFILLPWLIIHLLYSSSRHSIVSLFCCYPVLFVLSPFISCLLRFSLFHPFIIRLCVHSSTSIQYTLLLIPPPPPPPPPPHYHCLFFY